MPAMMWPLPSTPQRLTTQPQGHGFVFFAVGRGPRTVEDAITGRLEQGDAVVLAQLGLTLDITLLGAKVGLAYRLRLKPVEVVRKVDDRIRAVKPATS